MTIDANMHQQLQAVYLPIRTSPISHLPRLLFSLYSNRFSFTWFFIIIILHLNLSAA